MKKQLIALIPALALLLGAAARAADQPGPVEVTPISHASAVLQWADRIIYVDPVGGAAAFEGQPTPDIVLVTDIHGDHLNAETLSAVLDEGSVLIAPQAVKDALDGDLANRVRVLANGEELIQDGFTIAALPMYNLPDQGVEIRHEKGRGNGYLMSRDGYRLYIAGDTADIPEMRELEDIDMAFVPMNLPYTMDVSRAADAVLDFAPDRVYPYHYRGMDGLADVEAFRDMVEAGNSDIQVVLLDWYPQD